jgi:hypothetical protein
MTKYIDGEYYWLKGPEFSYWQIGCFFDDDEHPLFHLVTVDDVEWPVDCIIQAIYIPEPDVIP